MNNKIEVLGKLDYKGWHNKAKEVYITPPMPLCPAYTVKVTISYKRYW